MALPLKRNIFSSFRFRSNSDLKGKENLHELQLPAIVMFLRKIKIRTFLISTLNYFRPLFYSVGVKKLFEYR